MYYKDYPTIKSPELKAIIVEQILVVCVSRTRFYKLFDTIRRITSFSRYTLKKYLFHLIEYGILSYQGENQVYVITRTGLDLLSIINVEKRITQLDIKDIAIGLE
jgi:predicted transcriptional regulator